ncbi:ribonuclease T2 family protein [Xanthobacter sediminis]
MRLRAAPQPARGPSRFAARGVLRRLALGLLALLAVALAQPRPAAAEANAPGIFDFYVLSLSWSPTYCEAQGDRAASEPQCGRQRPYAFVVHGLWPQYEHGYPEFCRSPAPYVPNALVNSMLDIMPSKRLVIQEWKKHGTCSGLDAEGYFSAIRAARDKVVVPPEFVRLDDYRMVSPVDLEAAFRAANPGLQPDMIAVDCDRRRLREVRICLSRDFSFRSCPQVDHNACRLSRMVMPPVRGN